jgi:hypothetical protein
MKKVSIAASNEAQKEALFVIGLEINPTLAVYCGRRG